MFTDIIFIGIVLFGLAIPFIILAEGLHCFREYLAKKKYKAQKPMPYYYYDI